MEKFPIEAGVNIECRNCNKWNTVPALKVEPGIKCSFCGAELVIGEKQLAGKKAMLMAAAVMDDVKVD